VLDGTLISIDRVAADRPYCSGKHRHHRCGVRITGVTPSLVVGPGSG
jgi:hypothetical protein